MAKTATASQNAWVPDDITELLQAWSSGDRAALEKLAPRIQRELHRLARRRMAGERANHPLQTTALINEAYIRLIQWGKPDWRDRAQFFAVAAQMMRRILVDMARADSMAPHRQDAHETTFDEAFAYRADRAHDLLRLDESLKALAEFDERKCRVVELRFFAGLSVVETADVLNISERTVQREWNLAKAWLYREIRGKKV